MTVWETVGKRWLAIFVSLETTSDSFRIRPFLELHIPPLLVCRMPPVLPRPGPSLSLFCGSHNRYIFVELV